MAGKIAPHSIRWMLLLLVILIIIPPWAEAESTVKITVSYDIEMVILSPENGTGDNITITFDNTREAMITLEDGNYSVLVESGGHLEKIGNISVMNGTITVLSTIPGQRYSMHSHNGELHIYSMEEKAAGAESSRAICLPYLLAAIVIVITIAALVVYSRIHGHAVLDNPTRRRILNYISSNPGAHFRQISRDLGIATGTLDHHLKTLEREEFIKWEYDGERKRYYPAGMKITHTVELSIPQQKILTAIKENPGSSAVDIARATGLGRRVVYYHLDILENFGLIYSEREGHRRKYYPGG